MALAEVLKHRSYFWLDQQMLHPSLHQTLALGLIVTGSATLVELSSRLLYLQTQKQALVVCLDRRACLESSRQIFQAWD